MEDLKEKTADLIDNAQDFAQTFYKLTLLKATEKAAKIFSSMVVAIIFAVFGLLILLFLSIALAVWIGDLMGSRPGGFLVSAGIMVVLLLILYLLKKGTIIPMLRNIVIKKIYD